MEHKQVICVWRMSHSQQQASIVWSVHWCTLLQCIFSDPIHLSCPKRWPAFLTSDGVATPFFVFSEWWLIWVELLTINVLTFFSKSSTSFFLHGHYPNATFQPSSIDCKLNSHHENIENVYSWNTAYFTIKK